MFEAHGESPALGKLLPDELLNLYTIAIALAQNHESETTPPLPRYYA
jgi:hypothetical protein